MQWIELAVGFLLVSCGVLWWDAAREQRPGFIQQSIISYGGLSLSDPHDLGERARAWVGLLEYFWLSPWFAWLVPTTVAVWLAGAYGGFRHRKPTRTDWMFLLFIGSYLAVHWLVDFRVWDRYLLGLVPFVALMVSRSILAVGGFLAPGLMQKLYAAGSFVVLISILAVPVSHAARSEVPVGGDHGAYDGIDRLASYMRLEAPEDSVLYHHWLGYHYRFYLFGRPLRLHWYPDINDLVRDATVYRSVPRYIAFPSWHDSKAVTHALSQAGIATRTVLETTRRDGSISFRLCRLEGPAN